MSHSKTSCDPQQLLVDWDALESRGALLEPFEHRCGIDDQRVDLFIRRWGMVFQIKFRTFIRGIRIYLACFHSFGGQAKAIIMDWCLELPWPDRVEWLEDPRDGEKIPLPRETSECTRKTEQPKNRSTPSPVLRWNLGLETERAAGGVGIHHKDQIEE
jgi:hypothetical protein